MSNRFYLACTRERVGSNEGFWCKNGKGYTTDLNKAHIYTLEEAQKAWDNGREIELPLDAEQVNALAVRKVDFQYIPTKTTITDEELYVAFMPNKTDGNDVYFIAPFFVTTTNFNKAIPFPKKIAIRNNDYIFIPYSLANQKSRLTFDFNLINRRKMITAAGLIIPEHIKRFRRSKPSTGKHRFNCPECGKINWQFNPEYFEGCRHCGASSD